MNPALQPFLTVALTIIITPVLAMWANNGRLTEISARVTDFRNDMSRRFDDTNERINRRFDDVNRRFDEATERLGRIERKFDSHEERIVRLEERTSPIHR